MLLAADVPIWLATSAGGRCCGASTRIRTSTAVTRRDVCELCTAVRSRRAGSGKGPMPAYDDRVVRGGPAALAARAAAQAPGARPRRPMSARPARAREPATRGAAGRRRAGADPRAPARAGDSRRAPSTRIASAIEAFNASEHPRTIAGVARSLGPPIVSVPPGRRSSPSLVDIVVAWELCWYRYEIDLADEDAPACESPHRATS